MFRTSVVVVFMVGLMLVAVTKEEKGTFDDQDVQKRSKRPLMITARSCLDHLKNGKTKSNYYPIVTPKGSQMVYCDLESERGSAWTLVLSYSARYRNKKNIAPFKYGLTRDLPVNSKSPNFNMYRMSHAQMKNIQSQSTHWRVTCNNHVDYRDYVRVKFRDLDPLKFIGGAQCKKVEYINVRGHVGIGVTAAFWQYYHEMLHHDSDVNSCQFGRSVGAVGSEDNFGLYKSINRKFRCTRDDSSTTNTWFGGYL
ncbi:uncharacterized protein LOC110231603 [Exaiptasia diaphana]|uniref:Fibrinogen C-terminal domain-containing protein n=1 Tax=Exaiptasia diaphana TaxID=2652724 RepID=A0A913WPW2_EXADI|nr:uncharacterized protein LOC110231603 [Exaiptasia diaphana]